VQELAGSKRVVVLRRRHEVEVFADGLPASLTGPA